MPPQDIYQARKLIKQKKYEQARQVLLRLDHPTADQWLLKLDKVAPPRSKYTDPNGTSFPAFSLFLLVISVGITTVIFTNIPNLVFGVIVMFMMVCGLAVINLYLQLADYMEENNG